jgi:large subunit ribosomal protein L4
MDIKVLSAAGDGASQLVVSDKVFAAQFNEPLVHQVVVAHMAGARSGTKAQKTRAEVSGGNSKPWKQKGTGRARAGTTRGPLWRHGGRAFAARPRDYEQKINRKAYRAAMRSILSELVRQDRLTVVEALEVDAPKTRALTGKLKSLNVGAALIVVDKADRNLFFAARNLPHVAVLEAAAVDPVSLVNFERVVATRQALQQLEARLT